MMTEMNQCEALGLLNYAVRLGKQGDLTPADYVAKVVKFLDHAHDFLDEAVTLVENTPVQGLLPLEELGTILEKVQDKTRMGFCLNIRNAIAAGVDLTSINAFLETMEHVCEVIGLDKLKAIYIDNWEELGAEIMAMFLTYGGFEHIPFIIGGGSKSQAHLRTLHSYMAPVPVVQPAMTFP